MIRSFFAALLALSISNTATAMDKAYFEIKKVTVREVTEQTDFWAAKKALPEDCSSGKSLRVVRSDEVKGDEGMQGPLEIINVIVDQMINIGKKIFGIVRAGKPVVNLKFDTANALPRGITCWSDLSGWAAPQSKVYNVQYENGLGMTVLDFSYRVIFSAGGSADGVGKYITNATVLPANVSVGWGFDLDAAVQIPSVFNQGTRKDPVAGMQMNMQWKLESAAANEQGSESYFISGNNKLVEME